MKIDCPDDHIQFSKKIINFNVAKVCYISPAFNVGNSSNHNGIKLLLTVV